MILVDSSVWVDYFKGKITRQTDQLDLLLGHEPLAIGNLILAEVLQGFDSDPDFRQAQRMLTSLLVVEMGGLEIAIQAAKNFRLLRRRGVTVGRRSTRLSQLAVSRAGMISCIAIGISIHSRSIWGCASSAEAG